MTPVTPMTSRKCRQTGKVAFSDREIIYEYFRLVKNKDINRLLDLFADDGIVYEPFSNIQGGLRGKSAIKPFLEIVLMANDGLQHKIEFVNLQNAGNDNKEDNSNQITTLVTFARGGTVHGQFTFKLRSEEEEKQYSYRDGNRAKKIQTLHIEFIK